MRVRLACGQLGAGPVCQAELPLAGGSEPWEGAELGKVRNKQGPGSLPLPNTFLGPRNRAGVLGYFSRHQRAPLGPWYIPCRVHEHGELGALANDPWP